jgi:LuxR family maltose regulon positive regulatory protein
VSTPLLKTKLHIPPVRPELVSRLRLVEQLNAGLHRKLTLVSAPAGFGKTTLLSEWIHSGVSSREYGVGEEHEPAGEASLTPYSLLPTPLFAWLSLDEDDNDLARFLTYLIAALQTVEASIGQGALGALQSPQPQIEAILTSLINEIATLPDRVVLIFDDYHLIEAQPIHDALTFLLGHLPSPAAGLHLVLATREDPPLPLARLRARGQLTEVRASDLRFALVETAEFLNLVMGLDLSSDDIAALETRTEGWIAGLQLAAISLQRQEDVSGFIQSFAGSNRFVLDYLVEEVLEQQPEDVQAFLLQTAALDRLTGSLCDAVRFGEAKSPPGQDNGQQTLEMLERANLFIVPLDTERRWYRYHRLFGDFLQRRLRSAQPALVPELYLRASRWYERQGMLDEAIEHALAGEDVTRATRLLDEKAEAYAFDAQISKLIRLASRLPEEERCRFPRLCIYYAWALQFEYQLEAAESALACAEAHLDSTLPTARSPSAAFSASQIAHHARAVRVYMAVQRGESDRVIELARDALKALPEEAEEEPCVVRGAVTLGLGIGHFQLGQTEAAYRALQSALPLNQRCGNRYAALSCIYYLMRIDRLHGALGRALANGRKGLRWIEQWSGAGGQRRPLARVLAHIRQTMALVHYERDELDEAARHIHPSTEYYELVGSRYQVQGYALLVDLHQALGEVETARECLNKLERTILTTGFSLPNTPVEAMIARRSLLLSRTDSSLDDLLAGAARWAETVGLESDGKLTYRREYELLTLAQVRIAQGRAAEVLPLLERLVAAARGAGARGVPAGTTARKGQLIAFLALLAVAHHSCGQTAAAQDALSRALVLGEPEGYVRTFVDQGPPMARLLYDAVTRGIAGHGGVVQYARRLLAAFPSVEPEQATPAHTPASPQELVEPLSERELEVLQLVALGLTNPEIAARLFLSLNTVKAHARNIYGKFGVHNRTQAVARARALGLLSST